MVMEISTSVFGKHKMAMEISMTIFFYKRKMDMEISKAIFFTNTKWPWKFPRQFLASTKWPWKFPRPFFLQTQNGHGNFQGQCLQRRGGGGEGQNDHGHFCVFSTKLEILLKIQRILSIRYLDFRLGVSWSVVDRGFVYSFERIINNCTLPVIYFGSWISSLLILTGLIYRIVGTYINRAGAQKSLTFVQ